jgi:hypothetical protein
LYALREAPEAPRHECDQRGARGCQKSRAAPSNPLRAHRTARPCYRELPRIHIPRTL